MLRKWVLPSLIIIFALLSILTLRSVAPTLVSRQLLFFLVGGVIFVATSYVPFGHWQRWSSWLYGGLIFFLILTQLLGTVTRGTRSWIAVSGFHIQPSQMAVAIVGILISGVVAKYPLRSWKNVFRFLIYIGIPAVLILTEPDLGTTIIYAMAMASVFFLSPSRTSYIVSFMTVAIVGSILAWTFFLKPYQKERITSFLNLSAKLSDAGYNAAQSLIAVGSGEMYGRGIGQGVQSHLRFLPERQTDFVFASFAEEAGFIGAATVLLLYAALIYYLIWLGLQLPEASKKYFCFLTATMITAQAGINIGMNMGILPITGITLPLFSYGGSSILSLCFHYGCVQALAREFHRPPTLHLH